MTTAILAVCPLMCLVMVGMMWRMRGNRPGKGGDEE